MHLISCDKCGTVFDANKLQFPEDIWDEEREGTDPEKGIWDNENDTMVPYVRCFHCSEPILKPRN